MTKRIILIALWSLVFCFGGAVLLGFASGVCFSITISSGGHISDRMKEIVAMSWLIGPMIFGILGALLGLFGKLPGTRSLSKVQDS